MQTRKPPWAQGLERLCVGQGEATTLKIIDLCVSFCYNNYWQANENAS